MQDSAAMLTTKYCQERFQDMKMEKLPAPTLSPDMNPIENKRGVLSRQE